MWLNSFEGIHLREELEYFMEKVIVALHLKFVVVKILFMFRMNILNENIRKIFYTQVTWVY